MKIAVPWRAANPSADALTRVATRSRGERTPRRGPSEVEDERRADVGAPRDDLDARVPCRPALEHAAVQAQAALPRRRHRTQLRAHQSPVRVAGGRRDLPDRGLRMLACLLDAVRDRGDRRADVRPRRPPTVARRSRRCRRASCDALAAPCERGAPRPQRSAGWHATRGAGSASPRGCVRPPGRSDLLA